MFALLVYLCFLTVPCVDVGATVARALEEIFASFGKPASILCDNGGEFCNAFVEDVLERWGVQMVHTAPRKPSTNGSCERANGLIKSRLASALDTQDQGKPWWHAIWLVLCKSTLLLLVLHRLTD